MNEIIPKIIIDKLVQETIEEININSLAKFKDGGAAILIIFSINHQKIKFGKIFNKPLIKKILRLYVFS